MEGTKLLVVRGRHDDVDPTYGSVANDNTPGQYAVVEFEDGVVMDRAFYRASEKRLLERRLRGHVGDIEIDNRDDSELLPEVHVPLGAREADFNVYRAVKSDDELDGAGFFSFFFFSSLGSAEGTAADAST